MTSVSIIIPLFNKARYIGETLRSVLSQTHRDFECLVIDNGSTDSGAEITNEFDDPRMVVSSFTESQGPGATRNAGLEKAKGDWILFLDADDMIEPDHLSDLLFVAENVEGVGLVAGNWIEKNSDLSNLGVKKSPPHLCRLYECAISSAPWAVHAAIIKRESTPNWPTELDSLPGEDIAFWFGAIGSHSVAYSPTRGAVYRTHTENCRTGFDDVEAWFTGIDAAISHNIDSLGKVDLAQCETLIRAYQDLYAYAMRGGSPRIADQALTKAQFWLSERSSYDQPMPLGIRLRSRLGISRYHRLTSWAK